IQWRASSSRKNCPGAARPMAGCRIKFAWPEIILRPALATDNSALAFPVLCQGFSVHLSHWQWVWLAVAAFCSGLSKTGIAGLGILPVVIFANLLPPRESTGALLPLLLCGDIFGVAYFRKHASWPHLWRLSGWVVAGVVAGYFALDRVNNAQVQRMIGVIL